ncbi:MAG: rhomboid family intramembrane serine protease [Fibrobacterota bacterium]
MFPIRDENPTLHTSFVTFLIVAVNASVWIFYQHAGFGAGFFESICSGGLIPAEILGTAAAGDRIPLGERAVCVLSGNRGIFPVFSHMFMHGGWFHIITNMWFLLIFGDNVEDSMGHGRFLFFYVLCGLGAAAVQTAFNPGSRIPMVGASGAIGGVMGAYAVLFPRAPVHVLVFLGFFFFRVIMPAFMMLAYWFLLQVIGGIPSAGSETGGVAFWAHIGGFITGVVLIKIFCVTGRLENCRQKKGHTSRIISRFDNTFYE